MRRVAVIGADDDVEKLVEAIRKVAEAKKKGSVREHEDASKNRYGSDSFRIADVDSDRMSSRASERKWWRKYVTKTRSK